jgi:hypothetical protein
MPASPLQEEPVVFNNGTADVPLFFRGRANIDGIVDAVSRNVMGSPNLLKNARNVVETGCSAGGLATYLHADYVRDLVPHSGVYLSMPISGYFLNHQTVEGEYVCECRRRVGRWPPSLHSAAYFDLTARARLLPLHNFCSLFVRARLPRRCVLSPS